MELFIGFGILMLVFIVPAIIFDMLNKVYDIPKTRIKVVTLGNKNKRYFPQVQISKLGAWEDISYDDNVWCYTNKKGAMDVIDKYLGDLTKKVEYIKYP